MKNLMKFLSLVICFELLMSPIQINLLSSGTSWAEVKTCPTGQSYNSSLNRCLTSGEVTAVNNAVQACREITDQEKRKDCYTANAQTALNNTDPDEHSTAFLNENGGTTLGGAVGSAATIALPLLFLSKALFDKKKRGSPCRPASLMLLYAGGASVLVGEVVSFIQHRKNLKRLDDERKNLKVDEDTESKDDNKAIATEAQSKAFGLLADNELSIAQVARTKKTAYGIATASFAAGAIMGTIEAFQLKEAYANLAAAPGPSQATIKRLTCGQDPQGNVASDKTVSNSSDGTTANQNTNGTTKGSSGVNTNTLLSVGSSAASLIGGKVGQQNQNNSDSSNNTENSTNSNENTAVDCTTLDQMDCKTKSNCKWYDSELFCGSASIDLNKILNKKIEYQAAKNLEQSKDYAQMMELMAEINAIKFENYSRTAYYGETILSNELKSVPFYKEIARAVSRDFLAFADSTVPPLNPGGQVLNLAPSPTQQNLWSTGTSTPPPAVPNQVQTFQISENVGCPVSSNPVVVIKAKSQVEGILNKAVYTPTGRLITNALLGTWMGIMTAHMVKQEKISNDRADKLKELEQSFSSTAGITDCKSEDRNDPGKPRCYCFTEDNKPNPARNKSKICDTNYTALGSSYTQLASSDVKVCVDENSGIDEKCSCRNRRGSDGKNTCLKTSGLNYGGISPGMFKMINAGTAPANDIFNGNAGLGSMNAGGIGTNAARIKKVADGLIAKDKTQAAAIKNLDNSLVAATNGMSIGGPGFTAGSNISDLSPKQALSELKKELDKNKADSNPKSVGGGSVAVGGASSEAQPEFGLTEDQLAAQETEVAEVLNSNMDMGNSDVNSSNSNIFDILSNRYQRSGMRRLFDEEGKTKAEKPAKTDIAP